MKPWFSRRLLCSCCIMALVGLLLFVVCWWWYVVSTVFLPLLFNPLTHPPLLSRARTHLLTRARAHSLPWASEGSGSFMSEHGCEGTRDFAVWDKERDQVGSKSLAGAHGGLDMCEGEARPREEAVLLLRKAIALQPSDHTILG